MVEPKHISREEELELVVRAQAGDMDAFAKVLDAHSGILNRLCGARPGRRADEDKLQEAKLVALRSLPAFKPELGYRFVSFVSKKIKWHLSNLFHNDRLIRIPRTVDHGKATDETRGRIEVASRSAISLSAISRATGKEFGRSLPCRSLVDVEARMDREESLSLLKQAIDQLPERDRLVIQGRMAGESLVAIGNRMGIAHEGVRFIQLRAYGRIREFFAVTRRGRRSA